MLGQRIPQALRPGKSRPCVFAPKRLEGQRQAEQMTDAGVVHCPPAHPQLTSFLSSAQPQVTGLSRDTPVVSSLLLLTATRPGLRFWSLPSELRWVP